MPNPIPIRCESCACDARAERGAHPRSPLRASAIVASWLARAAIIACVTMLGTACGTSASGADGRNDEASGGDENVDGAGGGVNSDREVDSLAQP